MSRVPMTEAGAERLRKELDHLKKVERPRIIKAISEARELRDLKENAEYHAAKEQQSFNEGRIAEIEAKLGNAEIIDIKSMPNTGKIIFGATATLLNVQNDQTVTYQIVGEDEADLKANKISVNSPLARSIIGKKMDDEVQVKTPAGVITYEVIDVQFI